MRNPAWGGVAPRPGVDAEHHPDVLAVDLDPPHEGADDVASGRPVRPLQPVPDQGGEGLQLADNELQRAVLLGGVPERGGFGLEPRDAPAQPREPRLELRFVDQPFGVAVDQPADAAAQLGELPLGSRGRRRSAAN